jgi:uncharacterized membrane protein
MRARRRRGSVKGGRSAGAPGWPAGPAWALWTLTLAGLGGAFWFDHLLRQAGSSEVTA